jgi:hypothetical protein
VAGLEASGEAVCADVDLENEGVADHPLLGEDVADAGDARAWRDVDNRGALADAPPVINLAVVVAVSSEGAAGNQQDGHQRRDEEGAPWVHRGEPAGRSR